MVREEYKMGVEKEVFLSDFTGKDTYEIFSSAMLFCRSNPGTRLKIPAGEYILHVPAARRLQAEVMNGAYGADPEPVVFHRSFPYAVGLDLSGARDVVIDARNVKLIFDGWLEAVSLTDCENVTINGLAIDYLRKPYSTGVVTEIAEDSFTVLFDERYPVTEKTPNDRLMFYEGNDRRPIFSPAYGAQSYVGAQLLRFEGHLPAAFLGKRIMSRHIYHFRPAILVYRSQNIFLNDVWICSQPGMGIVGFRSENIYMERLRITPSDEQEPISTNTDATHFTSCKGVLSVRNSVFSHHGDDAINVHGYYHSILSAQREKLVMRTIELTHAAKLDAPDPGDVLELVQGDTLVPIAQYKVVSVAENEQEWLSEVVLDRPLELPEGAELSRYLMTNLTQRPSLDFIGCTTLNNLARAVLIKTDNVRIEDCVFRSCTGTAIHIAAEKFWGESGPSQNIVIRNNQMLECGYLEQGVIMNASAIAINIETERYETVGLQKHITIENNIVHCPDGRAGFIIANAEDVRISDNDIRNTDQAVVIAYSQGVTVD